DDDVRAVACRAEPDGLTDATTRAGDEESLAFEGGHGGWQSRPAAAGAPSRFASFAPVCDQATLKLPRVAVRGGGCRGGRRRRRARSRLPEPASAGGPRPAIEAPGVALGRPSRCSVAAGPDLSPVVSHARHDDRSAD